jgi:hypothetical protein
MNPISVSQMGIALVPPCRDVQWVGPVPGGNRGRRRTQPRDSRLRYSELPDGLYQETGQPIAFLQLRAYTRIKPLHVSAQWLALTAISVADQLRVDPGMQGGPYLQLNRGCPI